MEEAFWRMQEGPNQWAASLRWLCFSETTLQLAVRQANRVLRQLSLGGPAAMQAGLQSAFEVVHLSLARTAACPVLADVMRRVALEQWES